MAFVTALVFLFDLSVLVYALVYFCISMLLVVVSARYIARQLRTEQLRPALAAAHDRFLPTITLLVPAYNEEVTIVESLRSLLKLRYPSFEIVVCNDGSKDRTMQALLGAFDLVPVDLESSDRLGSAPVRASYALRSKLPAGLRRLILIDKENGGKADALNACINVARGDYVTSMDADSLLVPDALLLAARAIIDSREPVVAVGAQVGLSNGCRVEDGRVVDVRLPSTWIARFQVVEYMRSFAQGRTALAELDSLLVLSGVFAVMRRDLVISIGGFLTKRMRSRVGIQYCGTGAHTVCEDMEIVVRLRRYLLDKGLPGKIAILPFATAWTEAPENYRDLGKQRARWYRGLLEVLSYHRSILLRKRFGSTGLLALPYQVVFEALSPLLECLGVAGLLLSTVLGLVSVQAFVGFLCLAMAANLCLSTLSVLMCIRTESVVSGGAGGLSLFAYARTLDPLLLVASGFLSNFGYRQYIVFWQMRGLWDFLKRKEGWDKFARRGFAGAQP